jgi:hypothetical protein
MVDVVICGTVVGIVRLLPFAFSDTHTIVVTSDYEGPQAVITDRLPRTARPPGDGLPARLTMLRRAGP